MARARSMTGSPGLVVWLAFALLLVIADQFSKIIIMGIYPLGTGTEVTGFFNIIRVHNAGAAFSFLADASGWQRYFFSALALFASLFIIYLLKKHASQRLFSFALSCVLGGAIGNLIDRVLYGHVVDFLDFHWAGVHFPAFNIADSAITIGAACLILDELLRVKRGR